MGYLKPGRTPPTAKLSHKEVIQIKNMKEQLIKKMAHKFGVSTSTIRNIVMEKTWTHIRLRKV